MFQFLFFSFVAASTMLTFANGYGLGLRGGLQGGYCGAGNGVYSPIGRLPYSRHGLGSSTGYANAYSYGTNPLSLHGLGNQLQGYGLQRPGQSYSFGRFNFNNRQIPINNFGTFRNHNPNTGIGYQRPIISHERIQSPILPQQQIYTSPPQAAVNNIPSGIFNPGPSRAVSFERNFPVPTNIPEHNYPHSGNFAPDGGYSYTPSGPVINDYSYSNGPSHFTPNNQGVVGYNGVVTPNEYSTGESLYTRDGFPLNVNGEILPPAVGRITNKRAVTANGEATSNSVVISRGGKLSSASRTITNKVYY